MIIPLDKLLKYNENKYIFTKSVMRAVDKINNIKDFPEEHLNWKVVPHILKLALDEELKIDFVDTNKDELEIIGEE